MTTEIVSCARCHCKFERTCVETEYGVDCTTAPLVDHEPICDDCEHEFMVWTGCPPIV